jgi:hypothetical protein
MGISISQTSPSARSFSCTLEFGIDTSIWSILRNCAQLRKVFEAPADIKVTRIVDGRFSSQYLQQLVILLDTCLLVVDMQRRHDAVGDDAGTETAWCAAGESMPSAATNCSMLRTNASVIGATAGVEANRWPL